MNRGVVMFQVKCPAGLRELKQGPGEMREVNRGFRERREATFVGPAELDCRLLIDDEEIQPVGAESIAGQGRGATDATDGGPMWTWTPGFYAGAVRAELIDTADRSLGTWWLDVSPDPEKAGSEIFEQMVEEISEFDQALLVGDEPARRQLGAVGENDDPQILFERLRRRESDLDRAVAGIQREPASALCRAAGSGLTAPCDGSIYAPFEPPFGNRRRARSSGLAPALPWRLTAARLLNLVSMYLRSRGAWTHRSTGARSTCSGRFEEGAAT
ncbi:MAG: hypothetical protein OXG74_10210 [Acidobacteria bacterium]|nr:hypothetical protein [Acidobacteriota bacterium]